MATSVWIIGKPPPPAGIVAWHDDAGGDDALQPKGAPIANTPSPTESSAGRRAATAGKPRIVEAQEGDVRAQVVP
jgi:hypothetical protein